MEEARARPFGSAVDMSAWLAMEVAWVLNGVLVGVVKGYVEYGELEIVRVGCVLDFLAANEKPILRGQSACLSPDLC